MQFTQEQRTFLDMVKGPIIRSSMNAKVAPSVMAALAISISSWNTESATVIPRNLYKYTILRGRDPYNGKCYSKDSCNLYDSVNDCTEVGAILYRAYETYEQGINDWISGLVNKRRSPNGPLKYQSIICCTDYKEVIDRLVRNGFMQDYLNMTNNIEYIQNLIYLIEEYKLYEWDEEFKKSMEVQSMSKKKKSIIFSGNNIEGSQTDESLENEELEEEMDIEESNDEENDVAEEIETPYVPLYRVRRNWEDADTQVFASPDLDDAREMCLKHKGYKIFNDDGTLKEDPFIVPEKDNTPKEILIPSAGRQITLAKEPIYLNHVSTKPYKYATGIFYFFDNIVINGKAKVTMSKEAATKRDHSKVYGCINIDR